MATPKTKPCTKCLREKPLSEFSLHPSGRYGRQPRCLECCNMANKARYWADPGASRKASRERTRAASALDPEARRAVRARWLAANPEKDRQAKRDWAARNRELNSLLKRAWHCTRRAREHGVGGTVTALDILSVMESQGRKCAICVADLVRYEVDHIRSLATGGPNTPENIQVVCKTCNRRKGAN